jgi:O-antigen ligase
LLVLAAYAVSFIAVDEPGLWFQESYRWAIAGVFYVICRSVIDDWLVIRWCVWAMLVGVAGVCLMSLYQLASGSGPADFLAGGAIRVYGSFGTPNTLAAYLEMTILFLLACLPLAWWKNTDFRFSRVEQWAIVGVCGLGMLVVGLTQSRGGWIGLVLGLVVLWWQFPNRVKAVSFVLGVVLVGGFLLTPPGQSQFGRFMELQEETAPIQPGIARSSYEVGAGRGALWATARIMISENPLTGVGAGEFDENYREYVPSWLDRFPRGQAHNVWLQMGAQAGVWGILAYAAWYAASTWSIITARRRTQTTAGFWLITGVLAVFVAYTAHSMVDYLNVLSLGLQLSVLTAIALNSAPEPLSRYTTHRPPVHSPVVPESA